MDGNCNAGTVLLKQKGWYKIFQVWSNEQGIANLLSILMPEEAGCKVTTPQREIIVFKRDIGICKGVPYIDLHEHAQGLVMIETVAKNMEMFTKNEIERAELVCAVHRQIVHLTDKHLRNILSQKIAKNIPFRSPDIAM